KTGSTAVAGSGSPGAAPLRAGLWREGDVWVLRWDHDEIRLRDQRGLAFLHILIQQAGTPVHALELMAVAEGTAQPRRGRAEVRRGDLSVDDGKGLEVIDEQSLAAYRSRLVDLQEELAEAEEFADLGRTETLRTEQEALLNELKSATGLGGRRRRTGSDVERARTAVRKRIKSSLDRIRKDLPALHAHLKASIQTGTFCSYEPEHRPAWKTAG
ncbi:MAG: ATPase, partial [bacterium]